MRGLKAAVAAEGVGSTVLPVPYSLFFYVLSSFDKYKQAHRGTHEPLASRAKEGFSLRF